MSDKIKSDDIYADVQTIYSMRLGEGANESDAWRLACEDCEALYQEQCAEERIWIQEAKS